MFRLQIIINAFNPAFKAVVLTLTPHTPPAPPIMSVGE